MTSGILTETEALVLILATFETHPGADTSQLALAIVEALTAAGLTFDREPGTKWRSRRH